MPIYQRRGLRQRLGTEFLHDTLLGQTSGSWGELAGSYNIIDSSLADPTASGEQVYYRHWLRLVGSAGFIQDLRVGSFNTGSGAYLGAQTLATTIFSGMPFEVHGMVNPDDKDTALDAAIRDVKALNEVPIWAIQDGHIYSLGREIIDVIDVKVFSDPSSSLDRSVSMPRHFKLVQTASGQELRISPSYPSSYQIVMQAITEVSLGAGDLATINLPSDSLVLWGAAKKCYWLLEQASPAQEVARYKERRREATIAHTRLAMRFQPKIARRIQLDESW